MKVTLAGAAAETGAGNERVAKGGRGAFARKPEVEATQDHEEEEERGGVFEGAEGLVLDASKGDLVVKLADRGEEDAGAAGAGAEDATGAGVGEEHGAILTGGNLGGAGRIVEDGQAGEWFRRDGGGVGEEGRGRDADGGGGMAGVEMALGEGDDLGLEGDDAAGEGEKGDDQADDEADGKMEPEKESTEGHGSALEGGVLESACSQEGGNNF